MELNRFSKGLLLGVACSLAVLAMGASRPETGRYEIETAEPLRGSGPFVFRLDRSLGDICMWRAGGEFPGPVALRFLGCAQSGLLEE